MSKSEPSIADLFEASENSNEQLKKDLLIDGFTVDSAGEVITHIQKKGRAKKGQSKKPKEQTLNIFEVLGATDKQDYEFFNKLNEKEQKSVDVWVIQRWLSSKKLNLINEITNPLISNVPKSIAWRLFCAIGLGKSVRYKFFKPPKKKSGADKMPALIVIADFYDCSTKVAKTYLPLLSPDSIVEMAMKMGYEDNEIKDIKKVLK